MQLRYANKKFRLISWKDVSCPDLQMDPFEEDVSKMNWISAQHMIAEGVLHRSVTGNLLLNSRAISVPLKNHKRKIALIIQNLTVEDAELIPLLRIKDVIRIEIVRIYYLVKDYDYILTILIP